MRSHALCRLFSVLLSGVVAGCSLQALNPMPRIAPFFVPDPQDAKLYQALGQKADHLLATCSPTYPCERAHFVRGMVALYEDRELAATHFKAAAAAAPASNAGTASLFWLDLLKNSHPYSGQGPFANATVRLLRELVDQELMLRHAMNGVAAAAETAPLKQELKSRDKQIEDLTKQLEALKQIDREMRDMTLPNRPPSKTAPALKQSETP